MRNLCSPSDYHYSAKYVELCVQFICYVMLVKSRGVFSNIPLDITVGGVFFVARLNFGIE